MKHFCFRLLSFAILFFLLPARPAAQDTSLTRSQRLYTITGFIQDNITRQVVTNATVELVINGNSIKSTSTNTDGMFTISIQKLQPFNIRVSAAGYQTFNSPIYPVTQSFKYDLGTLLLSRIPAETPEPRPTQVKTTNEVITEHIEANSIYPTRGAFELFYALNPELRDKKEIPANYKIIAPSFPDFKEKRKLFNNRFDQDKNKGEPFISLVNDRAVMNNALALDKNRGSHFFTAAKATAETKDYVRSNTSSLNENESNVFFYAGKPKKFVFVIWKYGADGKPITEGPEVEGHYKVIYFNDRVRNVSSNASYGYAPMYDSKYTVEVYDQKTGVKLNASDDVIDPRKYFESKSLLILFNVSWTKIPIQVYD